jgi:heat shock protein HslJ
MSACNNSKKSSEERTIDLFSMHPSDFQADFVAYGNDSTWKVSVMYDEMIIYTNKLTNQQIRIDNPKQVLAAGADALTIEASNDGYYIKVYVDPSPCDNDNGYHMRISVKEIGKTTEQYTSCGKYTGDKRLYNIWTLVELNGEQIDRSAFTKQPPFMDLNLKDATVNGFGGCNEFSGQLSFGYDKITLGPLLATRMYCGEDSKVESLLFELLNKGFLVYSVDNKKLVLETRGVSAVFYKVD